MGDLVVDFFVALGVASVLLLLIGAVRRSRPLLVLGGSLLGSVILTWVLGLLGLPVGIVFGFLGTGAFFRRGRAGDTPPAKTSTGPTGPEP